ncbi:cupin domain-containing protein [Labrenzia sp. OB1]|uniref:cupin domain-containing protein n=1 Tax=Labrenzia sp. OB1 TaxID=1561204 RepID=UPI0007B275D3|nr:cupin domain-containing protein [Labrenzia sp. OB1]KZM50376.1 mannose-6-phosphate isomerase [Labrenzia sp. OB1]
MPPEKLNIVASADAQVSQVFDPHIVGAVNESYVKVAKFGDVFDWHSHENEDEGFLVLRGRIALDFRDGSVELGEGDFMVVPRTVEHRPRSLTDKPVVVMFEPATTLNTGDAESDLTVHDLKRLHPL